MNIKNYINYDYQKENNNIKKEKLIN